MRLMIWRCGNLIQDYTAMIDAIHKYKLLCIFELASTAIHWPYSVFTVYLCLPFKMHLTTASMLVLGLHCIGGLTQSSSSSTTSSSSSAAAPSPSNGSPQLTKVTDAQGNQIPLEHQYGSTSHRSSHSSQSSAPHASASSHPKNIYSHKKSQQNHALNKREWGTDSLISCDASEHGTRYEFYLSTCNRPDTRSWSCQSIDTDLTNDTVSNALKTSHGSCSSNQICVDGIQNTLPGHSGPVAYCADVENYINITTPLIQQMSQNQPLIWYYDQPFGVPGSPSHDIEVIFAGKTADDHVTMQSISIVAQNGTGTQWNNLGTEGCTNCTSWGVQPVPQGTSRFEVTGVFPAGTTEGTMFWWSI